VKGPELLEFFEDNWETEMGAWFPSERVVIRGRDLFRDFSSSSWLNYLYFVITGKENEAFCHFVETMWIVTSSYPEPRIWPNRIAALAGTTRSTCALGVSAGLAACEATIYGLKPNIGAIAFLKKAIEYAGTTEQLQTFVLDYLASHRVIPGYGRPLARVDERISPAVSLAKQSGFGDGEFLKLAFSIEDILFSKKKMRMNIGAVTAAIAADVGMSQNEYYQITILGYSGGMFASMIDAMTKPQGSFFPLKVSRTKFIGQQEPRKWEE